MSAQDLRICKKLCNFAAHFKWSNMKMNKCKNILFFLQAALAFAACTEIQMTQFENV